MKVMVSDDCGLDLDLEVGHALVMEDAYFGPDEASCRFGQRVLG